MDNSLNNCGVTSDKLQEAAQSITQISDSIAIISNMNE